MSSGSSSNESDPMLSHGNTRLHELGMHIICYFKFVVPSRRSMSIYTVMYNVHATSYLVNTKKPPEMY